MGIQLEKAKVGPRSGPTRRSGLTSFSLAWAAGIALVVDSQTARGVAAPCHGAARRSLVFPREKAVGAVPFRT